MRKPRGYVCMHADPISSISSVISAIRHDKRSREVKNANYQLSIDNGWVIGDPKDNHEKIFKDKIKSVSKKIRSNAIYAKMIVITASPEFFRPHAPYAYGVYDPAITHLFEQAAKKWIEAEFKCFVLYMVSHLDEGTPHIHCLVIPITDDNELNHERFFGGPGSKMEEMQDRCASFFYELGLKRGRKGSYATHVNIEKYYCNVMRPLHPLPQLPIQPVHPGPEPKFGLMPNSEERALKKKYEENLKKYQLEMEYYNKKLMEAYKVGYDICIQYQQKAMHCEFMQDTYDDLLDRMSYMDQIIKQKNIELKHYALTNHYELIEDFFGIQQAPESFPKDGYRTYLTSDNQRIVVYPKENHWQYTSGMRGGKGAITLLAELLEPFSPGSKEAADKAMAFITKNFGRQRVINDYAFHLLRQPEKIINEIPIPKPKSEAAVDQSMKMLSQQYHIPSVVLSDLKMTGKVSADYNANLIFPFNDKTGYYSRSSNDSTDSPKPRFARVTPKNQPGAYSLNGNSTQVIIVSEPMDVIAVYAIDSEVCAMVFNSPSAALLDRYLKQFKKIIWGIALDTEELNKLKDLVVKYANATGIEFTEETKLSQQKRYKSWHRLLKNNPALLGSGVLPKIPEPEPRAPAPRLRPVRPKGPRM